jgi:hypothetical protein
MLARIAISLLAAAEGKSRVGESKEGMEMGKKGGTFC